MHTIIRNGRVVDIQRPYRAGRGHPRRRRPDRRDRRARHGRARGRDACSTRRSALLHPGLINAHTHGHGNLAKGMGDRWTLELLLAAAPWIGGNRTLEDKYLSTLIGAVEMVLKGCTACYDLSFEFPTPSIEGLEAVGRGLYRRRHARRRGADGRRPHLLRAPFPA